MDADQPPARGCAVLVTRPAGSAADVLCEALRGAGYTAIAQPLLEILPLQALPASGRSMVRALDRYQHIIFVSGNAVHIGMRWLQAQWPRLPREPHWYAVGEATGALLREYGVCPRVPAEQMSSEGLLALAGLQRVDGQRALIVKGCGGRDTLRNELNHRGARVDELCCYRRRAVRLDEGALGALLQRYRVEVVLISSGESLAALRELLGPGESSKFSDRCLIVPSERVAAQARDAGFRYAVVADNASDAAMLRALEHWICRHGEK